MNETISKIINHPIRNHVLVGTASFIGGGAVGYFLARRQLLMRWSYQREICDEMTGGVDLSKINLREVTLDPRDDKGFISVSTTETEPEPVIIDHDVYVDRGGEFVAEQLGSIVELAPVDEEPAVVTHNIFAETDNEWDMEEELKKRSSDQPYVLHRDEFYAEENDFTQVTLTYYAGDDILVDQEDKPIYNYSNVVGDLLFGHGSGDPKVFHVRNEKLECEYEILRDEGLYSVEVLGLEIEDNARARDVRHSAFTKFRDSD